MLVHGSISSFKHIQTGDQNANEFNIRSTEKRNRNYCIDFLWVWMVKFSLSGNLEFLHYLKLQCKLLVHKRNDQLLVKRFKPPVSLQVNIDARACVIITIHRDNSVVIKIMFFFFTKYRFINLLSVSTWTKPIITYTIIRNCCLHNTIGQILRIIFTASYH